jgi:Fe-S cluster assembly iron-binding protein IscA
MLTVTDRAAQHLHEIVTRKEESDPRVLRIASSEEGYQLTPDEEKDGDQVFEHEGDKYLLLDTEVGEALSSATLDVQESPEGPRLTLSEAAAS